MKKFLFIIQFDSFSKTPIPVIEHLLNNAHHCDVVLLKQKFYKKSWMSNDILLLFENIKNKLGIFGVYNKRTTMKFIKDNEYHVAIIGTTYTALIKKIDTHLKKYKLKTKLASGYVGALLSNNEESFIKGVQRRGFSDLIWVPGEEAKETILSLNIINNKKTKIVNTGLPRFDNLFEQLDEIKSFSKKNIIFFEQPTFPKNKHERIHLVEQLIHLAIIYKDHNIIIKPRFSEKIGHAHRPKYLLQNILAKINNKPNNIKISYNNIYDLFKECKLALTISSTAGLESLLAGIPTLFISDFCNNDNLYGSADFNKYNATISFEKLFNKEIPTINYKPLDKTITFDGKNTSRLTQELISLAKNE